jgi:hypothetical protein
VRQNIERSKKYPQNAVLWARNSCCDFNHDFEFVGEFVKNYPHPRPHISSTFVREETATIATT